MAAVTHVENADGSHSLGVKINGKYVPLVTVPAERVGQLVYEAQAAPDTEETEPEEGSE